MPNAHPAAVPLEEKPKKRVVTFIDGQNLFRSALEAFGYNLPNFDPLRLSLVVTDAIGCHLELVCFYTGVPKREDSEFWNLFWAAKNRSLGRNPRIKVFTRPTQYRDRYMVLPRVGQSRRADAARFTMPDGLPMPPGTQLYLPEGRVVDGEFRYRVGEEKGIDVRIALDMVRMTHRRQYDVAVVFSQDQDLSEAVKEVKAIANEQERWVDVYSAFPVGDTTNNRDPIGGARRYEIHQALYDSCIDPTDYRPRRH